VPRFSEIEKERIRQELKAKGEQLFSTIGVKKVSIDDLVKAVGIAKASFYVFYPSKEYLYMDIVQEIQGKIFLELESLLKSNTGLKSKERVLQLFSFLYQNMSQYPILSQIDSATVEYLKRKLPREIAERYEQSNFNVIQDLCRHGIQFICSAEIASITFQAVYTCWLSLQNMDFEIQKSVIDTILNGVINQIVADEA
jgi:AcrR family transcriptional regulator